MSQSAVVPEQVCRHQPFELPETVTCRSLAGMSSTGVVQRLRNTARRTCWVSVEQHRSPCRSSGVGACSCQRWADSRQPDTSVHCCIDTGRPGQRPYFRRYLLSVDSARSQMMDLNWTADNGVQWAEEELITECTSQGQRHVFERHPVVSEYCVARSSHWVNL